MIRLEIIKEQYQRMPDDELIRFAKDESKGLTLESFHLLKSELEFRDIDISIIQNLEAEKKLADAAKISDFENITAFEFTKTIFEFAFNEKERGITDEELYNSLVRKNITSDYAHMLIQSIDSKAKEIIINLNTEIVIGWIFTVIGGLLVMFKINSADMFLLWGGILLLGGIIRLAVSYTKKRKFQSIVNNIQAEQEELQTNLYQ